MELKKRGIFFTADAILALLIIFFVVILVVPQSNRQRYETQVHTDILESLSKLTIQDVSYKPEIQNYISSGQITNTEKTVLEQIGEFYVINPAQAKNLAAIMLDDLNINENIGIWFDDELIYSSNKTPIENATDIDVSKQIISGINNDTGSVTAFSSRAYLESDARVNYFYFGGYVGEGNISVRVYTNGTINSANMELAISDDFDLYVNDVLQGNYAGSPNDFEPVAYTLSNLSDFQSGENIMEFRGDNLHISGGYLKITTENDVQFGSNVRYYPPGVDGLINIFDGFYVPSELAYINISLHANSTTSPLFVSIGNTTIYNDSTNDEEIILIDNSTISALIDYNDLVGKTTPIRIGLDNVTYEGITQLIDAFSVVDLSGSMACSVTGNNCHTSSSNCNSCGGVWQKPIEDAKSATDLFVNLILNTTGNKVGLVGYESTARDSDYHELSDDNESLINLVNTEWDASGSTCICCGINRAVQGFIESLSEPGLGTSGTVQSRVASGDNDAEELESDGDVLVDNVDLELTNDPGYHGGNQEVGMRFQNIEIPRGATITDAYIDFEADESDSGTTHLTFSGEDADDASLFSTTDYNITNRPKTSAQVTWSNVPSWSTNGNYQTPDLSSIIQEIVDRGGWSSGNAIVVIVNGTGARVAEAYEGESNNAPLLVIDYTTIPATCGNGIIEGSEQCDDANANNNDDCTNECTAAACFDGVIWDEGSGSEQCDDGGICTGDNSTSCLRDTDCAIAGGVCEAHPNDGCSETCQIEDRFKSLVVMSDGQATVECSEQGTTGDLNGDGNADRPEDDSIQAALDACNDYGIQVISIAFGSSADIPTMTEIGTAHACDGAAFISTTTPLADIYAQIAQDIQTEYIEQTISVEGVYSKLFPDSYIALGYTPEQNPGGLVFSLEEQFSNNYTGSFSIPNEATIIKTEVTSYSGPRWTSLVSINDNFIYNISEYGNDLISIGDPFKVNIPNAQVLSSGTNTVNLTTASSTVNLTEPGSEANKIIFTVAKNISEFSGLKAKADGCEWTIEFESGNTITTTIPNTINASMHSCQYTPVAFDITTSVDDDDDAYQVAVFSLLQEIDIDLDGRVDVPFSDQDLQIALDSVSGIPWSFSTEVQARRWY